MKLKLLFVDEEEKRMFSGNSSMAKTKCLTAHYYWVKTKKGVQRKNCVKNVVNNVVKPS